jgi:hypothetical protein
VMPWSFRLEDGTGQAWGFDNSEQLREMLTQRPEDWPVLPVLWSSSRREVGQLERDQDSPWAGGGVRTSTCQRRRDAGRRQVGLGSPAVRMCKWARLITVMSALIVVPSWTMSPLDECRPVCCGSCRFTDAHAGRASGKVAVPNVREVDTGVVGPAEHSSRDERIHISGER